MQETLFNIWVGKFPWRRDRLPTSVFLGFPSGSDSKESACSVGSLGSIPGLGRSPGGGHGKPLWYSYMENPHEQRSLVGYSPWGCKELDTTEQLHFLSFFAISFSGGFSQPRDRTQISHIADSSLPAELPDRKSVV